jgi:methyltransferase
MSLSAIILLLVTLQRLGELLLARRNTARLLLKGAREVAAAHYPALVLLHAAWLAGLWWLALDPQVDAPISWALIAVFAVLQLLRLWVLVTLGERWTTRILILPGAPLVRSGPYRLLRHPNYAVVVAEIAVLPLAFGLVWFALLFSILNAAVLFVRIRAENAALEHESLGPAA